MKKKIHALKCMPGYAMLLPKLGHKMSYEALHFARTKTIPTVQCWSTSWVCGSSLTPVEGGDRSEMTQGIMFRACVKLNHVIMLRWLFRGSLFSESTCNLHVVLVLLVLCVCQLLGRVWLCAIPWTIACQVPLSMDFSRQEYWSGLPFPPPPLGTS